VRKSLDRPTRRWKDNIKIDLKILAYEDVVWTELAKDWVHWQAFVKTATNFCMCRTEKTILRAERLTVSPERT
jgi:hypothetical protein